MAKRKTTRRALTSSLISLILCVAMLVGTTFAWFTDSVSSVNNVIKAGNLDVELYYEDAAGTYVKVDPAKSLFDGTLWEPGHVEVVNLKVANEGTLALKYQLQVGISGETGSINKDGKPFKLSDHIQFAVLDGAYDGSREGAVEKAEAAGAAKLNVRWVGNDTELAPKDAVDVTTTYDEIALVVWMPETVGNEANYGAGQNPPEIKLGINLYATQQMAESDSFGPDYDKDAIYADSYYNDVTAATFAATLAEISASDDKIVVLNLAEDVEWATGAGHGSTPLISADAGVEKVYIFGNGNTLTATGAGVGSIRAANGATLVFEDLTIVDESVSYAEGSWEFTYLEFAGNLVFNNVDFIGGIQLDTDNGSAPVLNAAFTNCTFTTNEDSVYGVWVGHGTTSFEDCTFAGTRGLKMHEDYGSEIDSVSVNNCTFDSLSKKPGIAIGDLNADTAVSVTNSNFVNCQAGDQGLYIYESDTDVTSFNFVEENNIVTAKSIAEVNNAESLKDTLTSAGLAGAGNTVIEFSGDDIDMTGAEWTPIAVDGYHGADIVTIDGNGATITGLTAPLFAGGFAGGSGIVIKNLTIADSEIVSTNTIGSGAFIESVDSMDVITLENCHLVDSTVTGGSGSRTGGLIGWTAGYNNENDGPVKTYVTIKNCSVKNCTITCDGSVGGIYGHAGNNAWTYSVVEDCEVTGNTLISTDDGGWRVGVVVGTANVGELTINNITESGNTLTQTNKTAPEGQSNLYGRFVPGETGTLIIDGVSVTN